MNQNGNLKRCVRARAAKTGESYAAALRHLRRSTDTTLVRSMRIAVAQTSLFNDPRDFTSLQVSGAETLWREGLFGAVLYG